MDLNRLRLLVAAPMASLFLVLGLCAFVMQTPASVGIRIPITHVGTIPYDGRICNMQILAILHKEGVTQINETRIRPDELGPRLGEINQNRDWPAVCMLADSDVSYGEFANFYSRVASSTRNLHIGLVTRQLDNELQQCPIGKICGLTWPDSGDNMVCTRFNLPLPYPVRRSLR